MNQQVLLCADAESLKNPCLLGLEGENIEGLPWLRTFCSGQEARTYLSSSDSIDEVWVSSSDDVDPINLAAALKKDSRDKKVFLLSFQGSGSLKSRAHAAGLDRILTAQCFIEHYLKCKQMHQLPGLTEKKGQQGSSSQQQKAKDDSGLDVEVMPRPEACEGPPSASVSDKQISQGKAAHIIPIVSANGGSGKSTIAALTALFAQGLGYKTLLIDADLQFGDMHLCLGEKDALTIDEALRDSFKLARLTPNENRPALLAAPKHLEQSEVLIGQISSLLSKVKSHFEVIIVNTGAFWAEHHAALIEQSSTTLFLIDQRPGALHASKHALDLCARCGIATHPFVFAVNRCTRNALYSSIDISCALQCSKVVELEEGGKEVGELLSVGIPFELMKTRNNLCLSIERMLIDLLPEDKCEKQLFVPVPKETKRFWPSRKRRRAACL